MMSGFTDGKLGLEIRRDPETVGALDIHLLLVFALAQPFQEGTGSHRWAFVWVARGTVLTDLAVAAINRLRRHSWSLSPSGQ